ncbi:MAG TPA: recombinase family protein, partial [Candidatus Limnocylindrales bacterium]
MARPHAYLRKSSVKNLATDLSPETQERAVRALAARHNDNGDRLVVLADWDISGSGRYTKKRVGYQQLLAAIKSGDCSAVYSYSLSRLGRSVHELTGLFALCAATDVPVRLVADAVDTSTASGVLLANVLASVAQFESDVAGERQRARYATLRALGREVRTTRRYGEKTGDNGEAEDAQAVLGAFRDAGSYSGAARLLNERGVKPRNSQRGWWPSSVAVIVHRLDGAIRT